MPEPERNIEPATLAEKLAAPGSKCPIPYTHDRLHEVHHWWHEMARWYHEPQEFRYALGAFLHAARSLTYMLQNEKGAFRDFGWYGAWANAAKKDPLLKWVHDTRNEFVHQHSLEPNSWLTIRCLGEQVTPHFFDDDDDGSFSIVVSPFECTHYYIATGISTDHAHEFERFWSIDSLPGRELLQTCAEIYDRLDDLVHDAHQRVGASMPTHKTAGSQRALPCMEDVLKHRVARTVLEDGREIWKDEPLGLHSH